MFVLLTCTRVVFPGEALHVNLTVLLLFIIIKTRLLLDFRLQRIECALMRNGLLRMRANEKPPTENTRSPSALLRYVLLNPMWVRGSEAPQASSYFRFHEFLDLDYVEIDTKIKSVACVQPEIMKVI